MKNNYTICDDPTAEIGNLQYAIDDRNNAVITWEWPKNRQIKLMFVFAWDSEGVPEIEELIRHPHEAVTRDLTNKYQANIPEGKRKFILVPAFFNETKGITVCKPATETDWLFRKITLSAAFAKKPLSMSAYQQITIRVTADDTSQMPLVCQILKYAVFEQGRKLGEYPLDILSMSGACSFFIKKEQTIKFIFDEKYRHLFRGV